MKKQFVTYEIALKLKKLGFNEPCFGKYYEDGELVPCKWYDNNNHRLEPDISAPLWQQAFNWLFKKLDFYYPYLEFTIYADNSGYWHQSNDDGNDSVNMSFNNLEEAILKGIELCQ